MGDFDYTDAAVFGGIEASDRGARRARQHDRSIRIETVAPEPLFTPVRPHCGCPGRGRGLARVQTTRGRRTISPCNTLGGDVNT